VPEPEAAHLVLVDRAYGHLHEVEASNDDLPEEVVRVAVAWPEPLKVEATRRRVRQSGVAALAVPDPRTDGERREQGEAPAPEPAQERHLAADVRPGEATSLRVVGAPLRDRADERREVLRIHLVVSCHDDERGRGAGGVALRGDVPRDDGGTYATVLGVNDDLHARVQESQRGLLRPVLARVVDDDDVVDLSWEPAEHAADPRCLVPGRDDDDDRDAEEHGSSRLPRFVPSCRSGDVRARTWGGIVVVGLLLFLGTGAVMRRPFPSDQTPEGAYLRIAKSIDEGHPRDMFAYLETDAQWAAYSIKDARTKAAARVAAAYPEPERSQLLASYERIARAPDGADVFALYAEERGWTTRLRRDLSGVAKVETEGVRASVVTARGTRYPFRRRENGIWGLTLFTAELVSESERAARDLAVVNAAADDYDRAKGNAIPGR
jgi:hypothetical protein